MLKAYSFVYRRACFSGTGGAARAPISKQDNKIFSSANIVLSKTGLPKSEGAPKGRKKNKGDASYGKKDEEIQCVGIVR